MWLLYVTFEDFVCLNHSEKSKNLFKTSVNIDNYLKSPNTTPKSNVYKKSSDKEISVTDLKVCTKNYNQSIIVKSELILCSQDNQGTCSKTIIADQTDNERTKHCCKEFTVGYQIAYIQRLERLHKNNNKCLNTKVTCNVVNQGNSMEVEPSYRNKHKTDKMHYFNGHNSRNNKRCNKSSNCADIIRADKPAYFKDKVSDSSNQPKNLLSEEGGLKHQQIRTKLGDNYRCKRYNPILNISNNCLNRPDDRLSASAMVNVNGCFLDPRVRTLPDTVSKFKLSDKNPLSLPIKQCWKDNRSLENLSDSSKSSNSKELKRSVLSPLEHAKPEQARSPKRHCIYMSSKLNYDLLLGENVHQDEKSLSDSFENVLNETQESKSQFDDILLKDVESEMSVANPCDASPMTISSGYESDSMQTCEAEIDHIFIRNKNKNAKKVTEPTTPTDYFSMSDSLPGGNESKMVAEENVQNVKRVPDKNIAKEIAKQNIQNVLSSKVQVEKTESSNPARFSPVQRQNYQLTKVARSMFEIIHDLQSDDESSDPNKKKFRKVRRTHSKDMDTDLNQKQCDDVKDPNENENTKTFDHKSDNSKAADDQSRMSVKCLRKPLGSEPSRFAMGRKNPKNIFMSNNPENGKRKDRQEPRGPPLGDARILKQIGELPFDQQNDSLRRRNPNLGSNNIVQNGVGNIRAKGPNSKIPPTNLESRPICEPRESEARVALARPTSLSNYPQHNNTEPRNKNLRPHQEFKRQTSYEPPRTVQNVENVRRHSKDNLLNTGSRESLLRKDLRNASKNVENIRRNSKDNLLQSDSRDNLSQTSSRESLSQNGSRDNLSLNSPRDILTQNGPRDILTQNGPRDNLLRNDSRDNLLVNNHPSLPINNSSSAFANPFIENQSNIVPVRRSSAQEVPKPSNDNQNRAVLLRGSRPITGFQDPHIRQMEQMNDNRPPIPDCLNGFQGNVPLWSCNTRMQIIDNGCSPYATARIPGCQTPKRDEKDDHVYETIPGDEVLYEEILRLRMKGILFPRFHNGKFVPFEPPALPARNGLREVNNMNKQNNIQRDINSNFQPTRASFNVPINADLISADLKSRMRSASWDGYSKIDNDCVLSDRFLHPNFNPAHFVNQIDGIPKRRENFYLLLSNKQKRADFSHSLELETKLKGLGIVLNDKNVNRLHVDNYETVDNFDVLDPPEDIPPQFLQSTYV